VVAVLKKSDKPLKTAGIYDVPVMNLSAGYHSL
jgi:hypothetical protein